jgi:hypothetical protein
MRSHAGCQGGSAGRRWLQPRCPGASSAAAAPASGRRWWARGARRRAPPSGLAMRAGPVDDEAGIAVPAGLAAGHAVVGAASRARLQGAQGVRVTSASRSAPVGAPIWSSMTRSVALGRQPQHGRRSCRRARRRPSWCAGSGGGSRWRGSPARLRAWCGRRRSAGRWARLRRGAVAAAVEDVVGAVVHQPGALRAASRPARRARWR